MNFGFTEEQELLRAEVRKFLDQNCPLEEVRKIAATPEGVAKPLWDRMARARLGRAHAARIASAGSASAGSIWWSCSRRPAARCSRRR